jgi:hypothetical protein
MAPLRGQLSNFLALRRTGWRNSLPSPRALERFGLELDVTLQVQSMLSNLDRELTPIRLLAERLASSDSSIDLQTGAALISHRPQVGTEAFACVIFPGIREEQTISYENIQRSRGNDCFAIPGAYRSIIRRMNGAQLFRLMLYGLPPTMCQTSPLLNRSARQPLDLGTANQFWRKKYSSDPTLFHFGGGPHSPKENVGYFLRSNGSVVALLVGEHEEGEWPSIENFLSHELSRAEEHF